MRAALIVVMVTLMAGAVVTAQRPEATSLSGKPLFPIDLPNRDKLQVDLAQAQTEHAAKTTDVESMIWVGRRLGYLWRYQDAIAAFSKAITFEPDNPRPYRHRGHRYISTREFDRAIADLTKAALLTKGTPDEIEQDGAPNEANKPRSTLQFNIWYHLALAHYLKGDFDKALAAYEECMKVSTNDDLLVATADWMWMTLMRLERKADAARLLERITPNMEILENSSYHRRLLMYKGLESTEAVLNPANADALTIATQGYGVANWYYVNGNTTRAREILQQVVDGPHWAAFGYVAAEADLQRMK